MSSCKKLVVVDPPSTSILGSSAYSSDATAIAVLNGLYSQMISPGIASTGTIPSLSFYAGLSSDEFTLLNTVTNTTQLAYYRNALSASLNFGYEYWSVIYPYIFTCNAAIEGLNNSTTLSPGVKQQLLGEAKFMRAFFYFYLVNLYGDVPLQLSTDYKINSVLARSSKVQVYQQIIVDLKEAQELLVDGYLQADGVRLYVSNVAERVRPNKYAATALLARAYLYTGDYINAETQASTVINNTTYYSLPVLNSVFLKNSQEAIWQIQPVNSTWNTEDARFFISTTGIPITVVLSSSLLNSFEPGDLRRVKKNWVNDTTISGTTLTFPYKYKVYQSNTAVTSAGSLSEYYMILRLGEQYLIRAEARAQQGNISGSQSDLNTIRTRAGLSNTTSSTQTTLITAIFHERQVELFAEMGQRWLDLKRTGTIDAVMTIATAQKGGTWSSYQQLYPIFLSDILKDPSLIQNAGY